MTAVALALVASACWGVADFTGGVLSRRLGALLILAGQQAIGVAIVGAVLVAVAEPLPGTRFVVLALLAGAFGAIGLGLFYRALSVGTMSIVAPISASGVTIPVIVGIATGDRPSALQSAGLVVTIVGVVLASRQAADADEAARGAGRQSVILALLAAVALGVFFTVSDSAADDSVLWLLLLGRGISVVLLGVALAVTRTPLRIRGRRDLGLVALVGGLDLLATGLYGVANTEGLLSIVAVVGALYPVATVLLARVVLRERLRPSQAAGVALAFAGVAAVAGG